MAEGSRVWRAGSWHADEQGHTGEDPVVAPDLLIEPNAAVIRLHFELARLRHSYPQCGWLDVALRELGMVGEALARAEGRYISAGLLPGLDVDRLRTEHQDRWWVDAAVTEMNAQVGGRDGRTRSGMACRSTAESQSGPAGAAGVADGAPRPDPPDGAGSGPAADGVPTVPMA